MKKYNWVASWGIENRASGESNSLPAARKAARDAYKTRSGAEYVIYIAETGERVESAVRKICFKNAKLVWSFPIGEFQAYATKAQAVSAMHHFAKEEQS